MARKRGPLKTSIISGGAGGLGRALSAQLITNGWHVIALDIDASTLESGPQLTPIQVDLTDADALTAALTHVLASRPSVDLVIYNAGVSHISAFADAPEHAHRHVFEINYFSAIALARLTLHAIRASKGTHLAISSVAGFSPLHHRTAYAASKHALEGFFASLRSEEAPFGVHTLIAAPSFISTNPGHTDTDSKGMSRPGSAQDGIDYMNPGDAAQVILKGLADRKPFIPVGRVARLAWWINSLSPRLFHRLMVRNFRAK